MFRFKQFTICQEESPMKVGTDGVLLGAWCPIREQDVDILDVGTGTGVIALMMAQRKSDARITGVDIDSVAEARRNADASPWGGRLHFVQSPVQELPVEQKYDLILSNPPFFVDSLLSPDSGRTTARHTVTLSFEELCGAVLRLLRPSGHFALVLPLIEAERFVRIASRALTLVRRTEVRTTPRRPVKRCLMEFCRRDAVTGTVTAECSELVIGTGEHECYTEAYKMLTRDFYLKF